MLWHEPARIVEKIDQDLFDLRWFKMQKSGRWNNLIGPYLNVLFASNGRDLMDSLVDWLPYPSLGPALRSNMADVI